MDIVIRSGHLNEASEDVPDFRKHLEDAVKGVWADHPRAEAWREALKLPRNHPGDVTRFGIQHANGSTRDREVYLSKIPQRPSVRCEVLFRHPVGQARSFGW